jgi:hypothetical protein
MASDNGLAHISSQSRTWDWLTSWFQIRIQAPNIDRRPWEGEDRAASHLAVVSRLTVSLRESIHIFKRL